MRPPHDLHALLSSSHTRARAGCSAGTRAHQKCGKSSSTYPVSGYMREDGMARIIFPLLVSQAYVFDLQDKKSRLNGP